MSRTRIMLAIVLAACLAAGPAMAQVQPRINVPTYGITLPKPPPVIKPPMPLLVKIKPSQAAAIAKRSVPNSKVLGVKLLQSKVYAVTLKTDSAVMKVMVSASTGAIQ
jgi:hypothetical protein